MILTFFTGKVEFITTPRGFRMIQIGKYRYGISAYSSSKFKKRWVCNRTSKGCRAAISTIDDMIVRHMNKHNH